jgi:hypothetical protein
MGEEGMRAKLQQKVRKLELSNLLLLLDYCSFLPAAVALFSAVMLWSIFFSTVAYYYTTGLV